MGLTINLCVSELGMEPAQQVLAEASVQLQAGEGIAASEEALLGIMRFVGCCGVKMNCWVLLRATVEMRSKEAHF